VCHQLGGLEVSQQNLYVCDITNIEKGTFAFYIKGRRSPASLADNPNNLTRPSFPSSRVHSATDVAVGLSLPVLPVSSLSPRPSTTRNEYHILLVEDNHINQKVLSKQLRSNGCTVYVANHGGEALEFLTKTNLWNGISDADIDDQGIELSLILMDLEMPVMDGLICTRKIRDLEQQGKLKRHVPIIAVTANTRMEQRHLALESGVNDIVPKPFQMSELMIIVNALMAKSR
jgi:CheY-like chemotaxis protein